MTPDALFIHKLLARDPKSGSVALRWGKDESLDQIKATVLRNGVAGWLKQAGIGEGDRVAILLPKGPAAVLMLFAVFQIGAVAAVLDVQSPLDRTRGMLTDLGPKLLVTTDDLVTDLAASAPQVLTVVSDQPDTLPHAATPPDVILKQDSPALILMTSGSTGRPKGVLISHGNLTAFIDWAIEAFSLSSQDRFLSLAPLHFDLSILDVYASQMIGAEAYLVEASAARMPGSVARAAAIACPTVLYCVPTQLHMLTNLGFFAKSAGAKKLRWVLSAGEVLYRSLAAKIMTDAPHVSMANLYGPTETNVVTCQILKTPPTSGPSAVPIGHPCPHVTLTLDGGGNRGEALIDGPSVMLGLVTGPANPPTSPSPRTYATGDILHRDADGALHFLGRNDEQIKLHGNRIELGDIEAAALALPEVSAAAAFVVGSDSDFPKLALCLVTRNGTQDVEKIAEKLASTLPKAAYPKVIVAVNSLPHTSSGKIDKAALRQRIEETKDDNP